VRRFEVPLFGGIFRDETDGRWPPHNVGRGKPSSHSFHIFICEEYISSITYKKVVGDRESYLD